MEDKVTRMAGIQIPGLYALPGFNSTGLTYATCIPSTCSEEELKVKFIWF